MDDESSHTLAEVSRRSVLLQSIACATGIVTVLAASTDAAMANKMPKSAVAYKTSPNGEKKCSNCSLFEPPNACKNVDGDISPDGWCILWRAK